MEYPDEVDKDIIAALRENPRISNKGISSQLEIAESTVAQRIRTMAERGVMKVIAQKHVFSDGYTMMCFLLINTSQRTVQEVCADIAEFADVSSAAQVLGNPDIFVTLRAKSISDAHKLAGRIGKIDGVDTIEICPAIHVHKYESNLGTVLEAQPDLDEGEGSIFGPLSQDGRQSNREISRQLGIAESTVRQRLNKMLRGGDIQFEVVCNPAALRLETAAIARITTLARYTDEVIKKLQELDSISFLVEVTGKANIFALATSTDPQTLGDLCDNQILSIPGVRSVHVHLLVSTAKHLVHFAHFDGAKEIPKRKRARS